MLTLHIVAHYLSQFKIWAVGLLFLLQIEGKPFVCVVGYLLSNPRPPQCTRACLWKFLSSCANVIVAEHALHVRALYVLTSAICI